MQAFKDKVAVVTGAASGIGRAIAERCVQEGMKIVLADVEEDALTHTEQDLRATGASVLAIRTDVSKASDIEELAKNTLNTFGAIHLLCNNAGVSGVINSVWESTIADWKWVMDVNLWGVIHGIRVFVPIMLEQDIECHIVNTASIAGLRTGPGLGIYRMTKYGVVSLSETLYHELAQRNAKLKVSVLCPGFVKTQIGDSARNRPVELHNDPVEEKRRPEYETLERTVNQGIQGGISPQHVANCVFNAIKAGKFYILTHPEAKDGVRMRMEDILQERNPIILSPSPGKLIWFDSNPAG